MLVRSSYILKFLILIQILSDMTGRNISQWLLKTRDDFYKRRYGGFEFGVSNPVSKLEMESLEDAFTRYVDTIQICANFHFPFYADLIVQVTWASTESADLQKAPPLMLPRIIFGKTAPLTSSEFGLTTKVGFSFILQRLVLNNTRIFPHQAGRRVLHT